MKKDLLFGFYDKIRNTMDILAVDRSASALIRTYYPSIVNRTPLKDLDIYELGEIDGLEVKLHKKPILHSWSEYKFPETKADALAPLGLNPSEVAQIFNEKEKDVINQGDNNDR